MHLLPKANTILSSVRDGGVSLWCVQRDEPCTAHEMNIKPENSLWNALASITLCVLLYASRVPFIDDAYITFRYSQRLADLGMLSWNNFGTPVLGTTSVLWTLLVSGLYALGAPIEGGALALTTVVVCCLLYSLHQLAEQVFEDEGVDVSPRLTTAIIAIATLNMPCRVALFSGMETSLYCLLVLRGILSIRSHSALAGVYAGLATLTRPDGLILMVVALMFGRVRLLRTSAAFLLVTLPWFAYSYSVFIEVLPDSVEAKKILYPSPWWANFFMLFEAHSQTSLLAALFCLSGAGLIAGVSMRTIRPFLLWLVLYAGGITASGIKPIFFWYFAPTWLFGVSLGGIAGVAWLIKNRNIAPVALGVSAAAVAGVIGAHSLSQDISLEGPFLREHRYREIVRQFAPSMTPNDTILVGETGILGFGFPANEIIDSAGINSREVREVLKRIRAQAGDDRKYVELAQLPGWGRALIERFQPTYIIAGRSRFGLHALEDDPWFQGLYERLAVFPVEHVQGIGVYRRIVTTGNHSVSEEGTRL
jgi:hypothetical protein